MADDEDKLRADARANRDRILDVAREALSTNPDASLNSIAKTAGVGAGTLYRHFTSREALLAEVYRKEVDSLIDLAPTLLAQRRPIQAFYAWADRFVQSGRMKHGAGDALRAAISARELQVTYGCLLGAVRQLLEACERTGEVREDLIAEDILQLFGCMMQIAPNAEGGARTRRLLEIVFRGLGATAALEPAEAISLEAES